MILDEYSMAFEGGGVYQSHLLPLMLFLLNEGRCVCVIADSTEVEVVL